jgi:P pilus assembly chaperone PapD
MQSRFLALLAALALLVPLSAAKAMTVTPIQIEMTSAGARSHAQISVVNNSNQPLPVEAVVQLATLDEAGIPKGSPAGDEFLVMPPQALIAPGATQKFRVQWLGDPLIEQSQSFLLYVNQLPVKMPVGKSGVQMVASMGVMINVAPPQGVPALSVVSTGVITDKTGKRRPTITVQNPSQVHALLPRATIHLNSGDWSSTLTPRLLSERVGIGLVQPGKRRRFVLPVDLPAGVTSVQASLEMSPKSR